MYRLFCAWLRIAGVLAAVSGPALAEPRLHVFEDRSAWVIEDALDPLDQPPTWIIQCPPAPRDCVARSGPLAITVDALGNVFARLDPPPHAATGIATRNYIHDITPVLDAPLNAIWISRLSDRTARLVLEFDSAVAQTTSLQGFGLALEYLSSLQNTQVDRGPTTHLSAMEEAAFHDHEGNPRLVPVTKPQSQFAIRSQAQPFPDTR